ncbi:lipase family alpha/beta hydrolase [Blastococcus sp. SYSU D00820]
MPAVRAALLVLLAALLPACSAEPADEPAAADEPGPVLLVPGYGGSVASMQPLADRLTAEGRDATVVAVPDGGTGDLDRAADALRTAAADAMDRTGAESVDVVGYSAGGLVARLWIADDGAGDVRRVVTLGSPHHGTTLADLAVAIAPAQCPEACRQMTTDSDLVAGLNADDETPDGPTWVSIWTEQDGTVTPPESARLDGALNLPVQSICADAELGHQDLPRDPLVQAIVVAQLAAGDPVPLDAADCARLGG